MDLAVFSHELYPFYSYEVYQAGKVPALRRRQPRSMYVEVTIRLRLRQIRHYWLDNSTEPCITEIITVTHFFDREHLKDHDKAYGILGKMISKLGVIDPESCRDLIDDIIEAGIECGYDRCNRGLKILPIRADVTALFIEHVNLGPLLRMRALEESALEFERSNYGMVPASKSSVKMLKRFRVEGGDQSSESSKKRRRVSGVGEDCVICLDKLKVGSEAFQMPCSHTFHGDCIKQWLNQSHYCPLCRYEMPTSTPADELSAEEPC